MNTELDEPQSNRSEQAASPPSATTTPLTTSRPSGRATGWWLVGLTVLYVAQSVPKLSAVPRVIMDENWEACTGYALAQEGRLRNPIIIERNGIEKAFIQPRVIQSIVCAGFYKLFGFSLFTSRLPSVIAGLFTIWGVFVLMRAWLAVHGAGLVTLFCLVESQFFLVVRIVRPEIFVVCFSVWLLALMAHGIKQNRLGLVLLGGIVGGVGCYAHPNTFVVAMAAVLLLIGQAGFRPWTLWALACYGLGGIIGLIPFFVWVFYAEAKYGVSFVAQFGTFYRQVQEDPLGAVFRREILRWWGYLRPVPRAPWVALIAFGLAMGLWRRRSLAVWAAVLILAHLLIMPAINRAALSRYLCVLAPWFAALVGLAIFDFWEWGRRARSRTWQRVLCGVAVLGTAGVLALNVAGNIIVTRAYWNADYDGVAARMAKQIPPGSRVYGPLVWWIALHQYPYLSDMNQEYLEMDQVSSAVRTWFLTFRPQYMVRTSDLCWTLGGLKPRPTTPNFGEMGVSATWMAIKEDEEAQYARRRGRLLDEFTTDDYGKISVYALR